MYKSYFSCEEEEAHKQGHENQRYHRTDYEHDKYSDNPEDLAYFDGIKEERQVQEREAGERELEMLREQQEYESRMIEQEIQDSEEQLAGAQQEYEVEEFSQLMENEASESQDDEFPITERELFNDILNDERE